jgi:hypothetical protein
MSDASNYVMAYAVIRVDDGTIHHPSRVGEFVRDGVALPAPGPSNVCVKEIVLSAEEAQREVIRLNKLNSEKGCAYFWQSTHIFLQGGSHGSASQDVDPDARTA